MASSRPVAGARPPLPWPELNELLRGLPTPSPLAAGLLLGRGDSLPEAPAVVARIAAHADLAAQLLALLNTRPFRREVAVCSLAEARRVHGERTLCTLAASLLLPGFNAAGATSPAFADERWLARNASVAAAARRLAGRCRAWLADEAFLAASLARIGVPTMQLVLPSLAPPPAALRRRALLGFELETYGLHHAALGAALLEAWGLPALLVDAVRALGPLETPGASAGTANGDADRGRAGARVLASLVDAADSAADVLAGIDVEDALGDLDAFAASASLSAAERDRLLAELEADAAELAAILAG